jgi:hypothetical protein
MHSGGVRRKAEIWLCSGNKENTSVLESFLPLLVNGWAWAREAPACSPWSEAATGTALLIVPSLIGQLLLGAELIGMAITLARGRHRPDRIRSRLLAGHSAGRHVDLQCGYHAVSRLRRFRGRFDRHPTVAGGRPAHDPDGTFDSGSNKQRGDERIEACFHDCRDEGRVRSNEAFELKLNPIPLLPNRIWLLGPFLCRCEPYRGNTDRRTVP